MKKSFLLAVLAYLVPTFITGFVWHLVAFHEVYLRLEIYRPEVIIPLGFSSMIVQGVIFAWIHPKVFGTSRSGWTRRALISGGTFAALSWSFTTLAVAAKHPMTSVPEYIGVESAFTLVQFALAAPLMTLAWRDRTKS